MALVFRSTGTSFDLIDYFTFDDAARALLFNRTGQMLPALPNGLTSEGMEYINLMKLLKRANSDEDCPLTLCVFEDDPKKICYISREHLLKWCNAKKYSSGFLFSIDSASVDDGRASAEDIPRGTKVDFRISVILIALRAAGYDCMAIKEGGKGVVRAACLAQPALFTESTFDQAWRRASKDSLLSMVDKEKYGPGGQSDKNI